MNDVIPISSLDLALAVAMMVGVIVVDRVMKLALGRDLTIGTVRLFVQLYLVGFILKAVFAVNRPGIVLLVLAVMSMIAGYNAAKRVGNLDLRNVLTATGVIVFATFVSAGFACEVVIGVRPWFNPQYVIPIAGMAMNGAMNGVALGISNLETSVRGNVDRIECALALGGTGARAVHPFVKLAARQALIPTINSLMTAGIVQLPGMMTGQIIAGLEPTAAIRYQIIVYYMLAVATTLSVLGAVLITSRRFFTSAHQLRSRWNGGAG